MTETMFKVLHDSSVINECTVIIKKDNIIYSGFLNVNEYKDKLIHTEHDLETVLKHGFAKHNIGHFGVLHYRAIYTYLLSIDNFTDPITQQKKLKCRIHVRSFMHPRGFVHDNIDFTLTESNYYTNKIFKEKKKCSCLS